MRTQHFGTCVVNLTVHLIRESLSDESCGLRHTAQSGSRESVAGTATRYGLDGPGIESRWGGRDFPHPSTPALRPTQAPIQWVESFPGEKRPGRGVEHPSPFYRGGYRKSRAIPLLPFWAFVALSRVNVSLPLLLFHVRSASLTHTKQSS